MGETWTTVADAATRLGVSTKTVRRRVKAGDLPSRKTPTGHIEVNVDIERTAGDNYMDSLSMLAQQGERSIQAAGVAVEASRHLADAHKSELQRVRRGAHVAWAVVWIGVVAAGFATWHVTRQSGLLKLSTIQAGTLTDELRTAGARAQELQKDLDAKLDTLSTLSQAHRTAETARITAEARLEATSDVLQATESRLEAVQGELEAERRRKAILAHIGKYPPWLTWFGRRSLVGKTSDARKPVDNSRPAPTSRPAG